MKSVAAELLPDQPPAKAVKRRLTGKQTDIAGIFVPPTIPPKRRRLTGKRTDTAGVFVPPARPVKED